MIVRILKNCLKCGKQIHVGPNGKWCEECRQAICEICGKQFRLFNQQIKNPKWGRFCSRECSGASRPHRHKKHGYWVIKTENHPKAWGNGNYYEHILVMERKLGRYLDTRTEVVHHKDADKLNNDPNNLELHTRKEHSRHHWPKISYYEDVGIDHSQHSSIKRQPKKGQRKIIGGCWFEFDPDSPMSGRNGYVSCARKNMSKYLGRPISDDEIIVHVTKDKFDDDIENLKIIKRKFRGEKQRYRRAQYKGHSNSYGYITILNPDHPMSNKNGHVPEHRLIMAEYIGRNLDKDEVVHHKNGNRADNRIENLELIKRNEHNKKHLRLN